MEKTLRHYHRPIYLQDLAEYFPTSGKVVLAVRVLLSISPEQILLLTILQRYLRRPILSD